MPPQLSNYVLETATAPGTGSFTLNGPEADRRSFSAAFTSGGSVFYFADDGAGAEWGIGTLTVGTPSVLARTTVLGNTANTKAALNFPGSVEVYNEIPAEFIPILGQDGSLALLGSLAVQGSSLTVQGNRVVVGVGSDHANYILQLTYDFTAAALGFLDGAGTWRYAQPKGDYSTNAQLTAEIQRATTIESNLQSTKANRDGGNTFTGWQTIQSVRPDNPSDGSYINYSGITFSCAGAKFELYLQEHVNDQFYAILSITQNNGNAYALGMGTGSYIQYNGRQLAYNDQLSDYAKTEQLPSGGIAGNCYYTKTNGILDQVFTITFNTSGGQWVSFPVPFSATPNVFACSDGQHDGQTDTDWFIWGRTKDGFNFNARNFQGSFQIFAKGPA